MAQAYVPIQTVTLTGTASNIEFTNIPQTYTDLFIVYSLRSDRASQVNSSGRVSFNGNASNYSYRQLIGNGSTTGSGSDTNGALIYCPASTATSSTFGNASVYIPNYTGSSNKSYSVDFVAETNATNIDGQGFSAGLWSNTSAITSVKVTEANSANFVSGSTATLYGIGGARASGGTITADARYTYHTFTSSGTFTALEKIKGAEVLCIAGGGGGGYNYGGGGGAGGLLYSNGQLLTAGASYSVIVGSGGTGGGNNSTRGTNGTNSQIISLNSVGGGGGGSLSNVNGQNGGSGGGASGTGTAGTGTAGQGNNGYSYGSGSTSGGGGGAGAAATNNNGGNGTSTYSSWGYATSTGGLSGGVYYYAGGGAGYNNAIGGLGGGGSYDNAGGANTGGGGGSDGKNGGSGLVIIRYPN